MSQVSNKVLFRRDRSLWSALVIALAFAFIGMMSLRFNPVSFAEAAALSITVNSTELTLFTDADANNIANIGDTVRVEVDLDNTDDNPSSCGSTITTVTADMVVYGGGAAESLTCFSADGANNLVFRFDYTIIEAGGGGIDVAADDVSSAVTVTVDDADEAALTPTSNNLGDGVVDTTATGGVDSKRPLLSIPNLILDLVACSGSGGICIIGDTVGFIWDGTASGDNNTDSLSSVEADLTDFGGGAAVALSEDDGGGTQCTGGTGGADAGLYCVSLVIPSGSIDGAGATWTLTIADDADNPNTKTDSGSATVDNEYATVTQGNLTINDAGCSGTGSTCIVGDSVEFIWDDTAGGDNNADTIASVTADLTDFGGGASVALAEDDGGGVQCTGGTGGADADFYCVAISVPAGSEDNAAASWSVDVEDDAGNVKIMGDNDTASVDNILPTLIAIDMYDDDLDGLVDRLALTFNETIADAAAGVNGFDVTSAADHGSCTGESIDPTGATASLDLAVTCATAETAVGDLTLDFVANAGIVDDKGNQMASDTFNSGTGVTITDAADPVILSVSPADVAVDVSRTASVIVTFSEAMDTTFDEGTEFSVAPDPGAWASSFNGTDEVVTLTHNANQFACLTLYTVTLDEIEIDSAETEGLDTGGPQDGVWSFTTGCGGGGGGGGGGSSTGTVSTTPTIALSSPTNGRSVETGSSVFVAWTVAGAGTSTVELSYSNDGGSTYVDAAVGLSLSGSYSWMVPSNLSGAVILRARGRDAGGAHLSVDSRNLTVTTTGTSPTIGSDDAARGIVRDAEGRRVAPLSGEIGPSPITGLPEALSSVVPGQFIRSYGFDSVYVVISDGIRRPFWDTQSFFTWALSWDDIVWVTDATLATMPLSAPMLPKPGVVLVKIQSVSDTYEVETASDGSYLLRWITSEDVAIARYGAQWADYLIDLEPTLISRYWNGRDQDSLEAVDRSGMKTRQQIMSLVAGN